MRELDALLKRVVVLHVEVTKLERHALADMAREFRG
jgi:hypothetical protein